MFYRFKVPPTNDVGIYSGICSNRYGSKQSDCLCQYNSCRAHDGLPPVQRMPAGTSYEAAVEYVLQSDYGYGHGWEDVTSEETRKAAREQMKCYRENEGGVYRIVRRALTADELLNNG